MRRGAATAALVGIVLAVGIAKVPFMSRAVFGDGQAYMVPNPLWLVGHGFSPFIPKEVHPPFCFEVEALAFLIWPRSPVVFHVLMLSLGLGSLVAAYLLGRSLFSAREALTATALLASSPLFLTQIGLIRLAVPLLFLSLITVYAAWKGRWRAYVLWGSALMLTKFSAVPVILAAVALALRRRESRLHLILSLSPLAVLGAWMIACRLHYGWFLYPENTADVGLAASTAWAGLRWWVGALLAGQRQAVAVALIAVSLVLAWYAGRRRGLPPGSLVLTLLPLLFGILSFSVYYYRFPRYMLPYLALWFILGARLLWTGGRTVATAATLVLVVSGIAGYVRRDTFGDMLHHESDLSYLTLQNAREAAADYLESEWFDARILASRKMVEDLTIPAFGYVSSPMPGVSSELGDEVPDVYYRFPVLNRSWSEKAERWVHHGRVELLREFGEPSLGVAVFRVTPNNATEDGTAETQRTQSGNEG
jgi:hypothetical protein